MRIRKGQGARGGGVKGLRERRLFFVCKRERKRKKNISIFRFGISLPPQFCSSSRDSPRRALCFAAPALFDS